MLDPRWHKVLRDLWINKSRTSLVILSIAIGIFAFGGLFTARTVILSDILAQYSETNPANITFTLSPFDDDLVRWATRQPMVTSAQGRAYYRVRLLYAGQAHTINLYAFDDYAEINIDRIYPEAGQWEPGKDEILLERSYLALVGASIGDTLTLELPDGKRHDVRLVGSVHDLSVMPGTLQPEVSGYMALHTLRGLGLPALYNQLELTIAPGVGDTEPTATVADELQRELRHKGILVHAAKLREAEEGYWGESTIQGMAIILLIVGFASLALSGFLVFNTISGILARQKRQIGIMKIIGASQAQIAGIYLVMVASFGMVAFIIALPASLLLSQILVHLMVNKLNFDFPAIYIPIPVLLLEITMALASPLLSAIFPILNGTRIPPAEAISDHTVQSGNNLFDMILTRIRGLPRPFLLSLRNTFRRKGRLALTLVTLTAAGMLFISIFNVRVALGSEIVNLLSMVHFDIRLSLDDLYQAEGVQHRVEQVPGVDFAEIWAISQMRRMRPDNVQGGTVTVYGLPPDSAFVEPRINEGRWLQPDDEYTVVIDGKWLDDEPDIQLGDTITLMLNGEEQDWQVVGILQVSRQAAVYVPYEYLSRFRHTLDQADTIMVRTTQDTADFQDMVAAELESYLDLRDIDVKNTTTASEMTAGVTSGFTLLVIILMGMAVLVAAVGGLGLAGTMSLNVLERTREIGVMRAVGAETRSVRRIFVVEGILIGLISWVIAVPLGVPGTLFFSNVLGQVLFKRSLFFTYLPEGPLIWLVIVFVISGLSSMMPAQRASRISIREALAYE